MLIQHFAVSKKSKAWRKVKIFLQFTILLQNPVFMGLGLFCFGLFFFPEVICCFSAHFFTCSLFFPINSGNCRFFRSSYFLPAILHWVTVLTNHLTSDLCSTACFSKSESYSMFFFSASNSTLIVYNCRVERWLLSKELQSNLAC